MTSPTDRFTRSNFRAEGFSCPSCVAKIEKQVGSLPAVARVDVKFASGRIEVDHDPSVTTTDQIVQAIQKAGYVSTLSAY